MCVPVTGPVVAQRVGRAVALLFHDHGTRRGWVVSSTPRPYFTPGKDLVPIVQKAGWAYNRCTCVKRECNGQVKLNGRW